MESYAFYVLDGPPGVGKTSLARIYANAIKATLYELSAVTAGKNDIRKIIDEESDKPKVLFLDEIHRFNKAQQDFLLPFVESGELVLIGATTENPSFEIISPLLSRLRVFVLEELSAEEMSEIIDRTEIKLDEESRDWLIRMANGDARQAITMLSNTLQLYQTVNVENLKKYSANSIFCVSTKKGEGHYNTISAFIKSMRASQPDAALYYLRPIDSRRRPEIYCPEMVILLRKILVWHSRLLWSSLMKFFGQLKLSDYLNAG
ncbi:MAG: AAA family ATPase [Blastocatellia bacterium]|nr:AAA family ATPase [Blastocatellia bacterium]